jgi:hypothetical protein
MVLRLLAPLAIFGLAIFLIGADVTNEQQNAAVTPETKSQNQGKAVPPTPFEKSFIETLSTIANQQRTAHEQALAEQRPWWIDYALLAVAIVYTVFAGLQWWAIRDQAKIAAENVIVTNQLVNLERPWISVKPMPDSFLWPITQNTHATPPFLIKVIWSAKNSGRTPAFITDFSVTFGCVELPIPNEVPQYDKFAPFGKLLLEPNGGSHNHETWLEIKQTDFADITANKKCVALFGYANYSDTIKENMHKTRFFCYWQVLNSAFPWMLTYIPVGPDETIEYI